MPMYTDHRRLQDHLTLLNGVYSSTRLGLFNKCRKLKIRPISIQRLQPLRPFRFVVQSARPLVPRHVSCDLHSVTTQEVYAEIWLATGELRGRREAPQEMPRHRLLAQRCPMGRRRHVPCCEGRHRELSPILSVLSLSRLTAGAPRPSTFRSVHAETTVGVGDLP